MHVPNTHPIARPPTIDEPYNTLGDPDGLKWGGIISVPMFTTVSVGPSAAGFFFVSTLTISGPVPVRIDGIDPADDASLAPWVRHPVVGFLNPHDVGLGGPIIPFRPFVLQGHQTRYVIVRGEAPVVTAAAPTM